ncbi:MAG: energy coupling factor transporter S component ThiW [Promethearchaeota archaeon]
MSTLNSKADNKDIEKSLSGQSFTTKKVAMSAIFVGVGLVLSLLNPFAYFTIFGTKINPFAHFINAIMGVLVGVPFALITALSIAILRFSIGIGTIHAFHGGMAGALVVGITSIILWKKKPEYVEFAAFAEPLGTIFIGGTIAYLIAPIGGISVINGLLIYWSLFALSSIPGCILGFIMLKILKKAGISREDYFERK